MICCQQCPNSSCPAHFDNSFPHDFNSEGHWCLLVSTAHFPRKISLTVVGYFDRLSLAMVRTCNHVFHVWPCLILSEGAPLPRIGPLGGRWVQSSRLTLALLPVLFFLGRAALGRVHPVRDVGPVAALGGVWKIALFSAAPAVPFANGPLRRVYHPVMETR